MWVGGRSVWLGVGQLWVGVDRCGSVYVLVMPEIIFYLPNFLIFFNKNRAHI